MLYERVFDIITDDLFLHLTGFVPDSSVYLKIEGLNPGGSIKLKTGVALVDDAEKAGRLGPASRIIESSSGNLGVALSIVCAAKGYPLTVVTDANASESALRSMAALGTDIVVIDTPDADGGFLGRRLAYIRDALAADPDLVWLNQYANRANPDAHCETTADAIHREFGPIDALFIGAGTTGTLMGCLEYRRRNRLGHTVFAVDAEGSVTFGGPSRRRRIPGLGASRRPEIYSEELPFEKVTVSEADTVAECRRVCKEYGLLIGGSTGTVLAAVRRRGPELPPGSKIIAISPDLGEKYLHTVYNPDWVREHSDLLAPTGAQHV
jgi:2,3-diaminopropionate biosynthesis protein SbnA